MAASEGSRNFGESYRMTAIQVLAFIIMPFVALGFGEIIARLPD